VNLQAYFHILLLGAIATENPQPLHAQTSAEVVEHRRYCERLNAALAQRSNQATYRHALRNLQSCPAGLVTATLLREWSSPPSDTIAIQVLAKTTAQFRDQRLADAVLRTAANVQLSRRVRLGSFHALVSYVDPHAVLLFRQLDREGLSGGRYVLVGTIDHVPGEIGAVPIRPSASREIVQFLNNLGATDLDSTVRAVARFLAIQFSTKN
jgi:hypothetical protein